MRDPYVSEDEARRLWKRAAELQAEAARRLEERSRSIAREDGRDDAGSSDEGYALDHVRAAAVEAGIGEEYVRQAAAELQAEALAARSDSGSRLADAFSGPTPRAVVLTRVYDAPCERVLQVLERVLPGDPFGLVLRDSRGGPLLEGGTLIFDVPPWKLDESGTFAYDMRVWADLVEVHLSVRALDERRTELTLASPTDRARNMNLWIGGGLTAVVSMAVGGGSAAIAGGLAAAAGLAPLLVLLVAGMMGLLGVGGTGLAATHLAIRPLFRWSLGKGRKCLERILQSVGVHLDTEGAFAAGARRLAPPAAITDEEERP